VLTESPKHAKVLQQLGWLYHQPNTTFTNQDTAIEFLTRSLETGSFFLCLLPTQPQPTTTRTITTLLDPNDTQTYYLIGRCYMSQQKYNKAYEAYQQAVYRDNRNPTYWCSIGVLYFQISQVRFFFFFFFLSFFIFISSLLCGCNEPLFVLCHSSAMLSTLTAVPSA